MLHNTTGSPVAGVVVHPLERCLVVARWLRQACALDGITLRHVVERFARTQALAVREGALDLLVSAVVADDVPVPLDEDELRWIALEAALDHPDLDAARRAATTYATTRGADADALHRLDPLTSRAWMLTHGVSGDPTTRAARLLRDCPVPADPDNRALVAGTLTRALRRAGARDADAAHAVTLWAQRAEVPHAA